ncbi:MAG: YihY/virulence factor BrkB family protein, partial [Solirubrobacterales bacterium]|nr:YihY/virulence factor BrkB family protein [Solirubrobacterales bacterium]
MDPLLPLKAFDRFQQRHRALGVPVAVLRKFSDDDAGPAATLIAYYAFVSIFPLLLLFTTGLGFVLQDNPSLQKSIIDTTIAEIPVIGPQIQTQSLTGNGVALAVGIIGTIASGLGVTLAAQRAFNHVYAVRRRDRPDFLFSRLRGLGTLALMALLQIVSTVITGLAGGGLGGLWATIAGLALSLAVNGVLFTIAFSFLVGKTVPRSQLWPGIVIATVGWTALQALGGLYVKHVIAGATEAYGTFATVNGLIAWLYLGARMVVYAAEINTVLSR